MLWVFADDSESSLQSENYIALPPLNSSTQPNLTQFYPFSEMYFPPDNIIL
jgi:hypothetical protein